MVFHWELIDKGSYINVSSREQDKISHIVYCISYLTTNVLSPVACVFFPFRGHEHLQTLSLYYALFPCFHDIMDMFIQKSWWVIFGTDICHSVWLYHLISIINLINIIRLFPLQAITYEHWINEYENVEPKQQILDETYSHQVGFCRITT